MPALFRDPSFLPSCILAGVGILFVVLAAALPPAQVIGLVGMSATAIALVVARLRRDAAEDASWRRLRSGN